MERSEENCIGKGTAAGFQVGIIREDGKYTASIVAVELATVKVLPCKSRTTVFQNRCDDCVRPQPTYLTIGRCTVPQFPCFLWTFSTNQQAKDTFASTPPKESAISF